MQSILEEIAAANEEVVSDPEARVRFRQFGDSALVFELLVWIVRPQDRGRVRHELNRSIYKRFAAENITIPFPQRDLWVKQMPGEVP